MFVLDKINSLPELDKNDKNYTIYLDALYYRVQISIEAVMDIISMTNKDLSIQITDDYTNIASLVKKQIISNDLGKKLKEINGLRNVLVHQYNGIDAEIIDSSRDSIVITITTFLGVIQDFIGESS